MTVRAFIGFGANLGDREYTHAQVLRELNAASTITVVNFSRLYETVPHSITDNGPNFLNGVIEIGTSLSPEELMQELRRIELLLGKSPTHRSEDSRLVDLDLLLFEEKIIMNECVTVPHPRMHERAFVLVPSAEIVPNVIHPILEQTIMELLRELPSEEYATIIRSLE